MEIKLLSCPLCLKPHFDGVDALRSTLVTVATSHLTCPVCSETLLGLDKLTIHLFSHIASSEAHKDDPEKTAREEIDRSIEDMSKTTKENRPEVQEVSAKMDGEDSIRCDICSFTFTDRTILEMHQKLLHQTIPDKRTGAYSYHCHLCSKKFRMRGSLMVHLRVAHYGFAAHGGDGHSSETKKVRTEATQPAKDEKDAEAKVAQKKEQPKGQDNKQWECDVCSKMFTTKYFLKKHKRLHTGEMPYCCTLCNKSFTFQQSYHKHMLYHSSEKPYVCNECGRPFKELSTLQNHARIHSGERPFGCETCGKRFRQRVSYLVHRRIHTGVMPYKCTACDKSFRYKVSQRSHKCPANPPGSVIRIPDADKVPGEATPHSPSSPAGPNSKCIMSVDLNTGRIDFVPDHQGGGGNQGVLFVGEVSQIQKKSITIQGSEQIEICFNKADLQSAIGVGEGAGRTGKVLGANGNGSACVAPPTVSDSLKKLPYIDSDGDIFSMVLSPILPEVESLCLNNSPSNDSPVQANHEENIDLIGDRCLEEFLYGPS
ncbi:hypothetical protein NQ318_019807 [Aromia moschata]|uniref:C2H2-type domain-containing protein n=1 Tax=Aromia moschata TaxID=1265417 RepID=A0AAV8YMI3_9CUCU|nr:hypothetical protein NQ318_019807 [Aromia moschata]